MILKLYRTQIRPEDNMVIENIDEYLTADRCTHEWDNLKYTQPELDIMIKVPLDGNTPDITDFNYASLTDPDTNRTYYYFILDVSWKAHQTLRLQLSMDTLNSFWGEIDLNMTDETKVTRRYFDRWRKYGDRLYPLIDKHPEEITAPSMMRVKDPDVLGGSDHWTLVYMTRYDDSDKELKDNPTDCFVFPENGMTVYGNSITPDTYDSVTGICLDYSHNANAVITYKASDGNKAAEYPFDSSFCAAMIVAKDPDHDGKLMLNVKLKSGSWYTAPMDWVKISGTGSVYMQPSGFDRTSQDPDAWDWNDPIEPDQLYPTAVSSFNEWYKANKTDPRLIKIIELPYAPFDVSYDGSVMKRPSGWVVGPSGAGFLLSDPSVKFESSLVRVVMGPQARDASEVDTAKTADPLTYETKLWNSNYRTSKFVYDNNAHAVTLENFAQPDKGATDFSTDIIFESSTGMDNSIAFKFSDAERHTTDFGEWMVCSRSTEIPFYTNEYLNYLRYGKAVDEKNRNWTTASTIVSGIGSAVSTTASLAFALSGAGVTGGNVIGMAIGATIGLVSTGIATASSISRANYQINSKIDQYTHQSSSVSVSSDVSLFREYGRNKLLYVNYQPTDEIRESIANYFRYYGYSCDENGKPFWNSRYWSDYFVINPKFRSSCDILRKYTDDIAVRMQSGFRICHRHDGKYDFRCALENWENNIL